MLFEYQARTKDGQVQIGNVDAVDEASALEILQRSNLVVVSLVALTSRSIFTRRLRIFEHVNKKEIAIFSRQLATLSKASVALTISLNTLTRQKRNEKLQEDLADIAASVDGGLPFSRALEKYHDIFSNFYVSMVRAGEESGTLNQVLLYLAEHAEREYYIASKVRGAMLYPAVILVLFLAVASGMLIFVIPTLVGIIAQGGAQLPLITRAIIGISDFFSKQWAFLLVGVSLTGFGLRQFFAIEQGREIWSIIQLRIPIFGSLFRKMYLFQFAESFGMLSKGGVPITKGLEITAFVINNRVYRKIILEAQERVSKGDRLSAVLEEHPEVTSMVSQMIAVGETSGQLDSVLADISRFYELEIKNVIDNLVSLIEPILIVILGVGVGLLVAGILLPVYKSISTLGR